MTRVALNSLLTEKAEQSTRFMKRKMYEFGNKPSKYLANLVKKKSDSQSISSIRDSSGQIKMDSVTIHKVFKEFYESLYWSEQPAGVLGLMEHFFSKLSHPKPNDGQKTELNRPITFEEVSEAIRVLQSGKALGPDSFRGEFYKQ